jgi:MOSC domain-containing protein YiiM
MKLVSINVGLPREVQWNGKTVLTSIFKAPLAGRVKVGRLNLEGDRQSDLNAHGGADKAVYVYPAEHYAFWRAELPGVDLPWGRSARISRRKVSWRTAFTSGTDSGSVLPSSW